MSTSLGIAAVSAVLRLLLEHGFREGMVPDELGEVKVTTLPPDKLTDDREQSFLNLFLYQVTPNIGWRNVDLASRDASGASISAPPLALDLHYLISAHGAKELHGEVLLGCAMRLLHETPVLTRARIRDVLGVPEAPDLGTGLHAGLARAALASQREMIKISLQSISTDEAFRLWTALQGRYRATAAYHVSVVLIESGLPVRPGLPVLRRGPRDSGPEVTGATSAPRIEGMLLPRGQSAAFVGDELTLLGQNLEGVRVVRFTHERLEVPLQLPVPADAASPGQLKVQVTDVGLTSVDPSGVATPARWIAGPFSVHAVVPRGERTWSSNPWRFCLAPRIESISGAPMGSGSALTVSCKPGVKLARADDTRLRLDQQVELILAGLPPLVPDAAHLPLPEDLPGVEPWETLTFITRFPPPGSSLARLRVDGVEMPRVNWDLPEPQFDESARVNA